MGTRTVAEALWPDDENAQREAINSGIKSLLQHNTWELVTLPEGIRPLQTRFVFRHENLSNGTVGRFNARLVVKGYMQGNAEHTYSPVLDVSTIRLALAVAVQRNLFVHQLEVWTSLLHGNIDSDVYILAPSGAGIKLQQKEGIILGLGRCRQISVSTEGEAHGSCFTLLKLFS